ncbi:PPOX class probable F420-dependent enzyme [Thermocatellispora tengchongensis]|uniref:PPOX class probable F420-dependent enzyme n=1 Tax=Thermocatellispora tengchongensis TaxID=1073253 RepID=A0A840NXC6_9ACTN|nr:PPOX class F420-dependent oxidoreductase [Thermocatellispora tengchongensis]MBB5131862.1 PPOX class probable F420-dependent enzyme [Thermocatellispora tengchongensis]
MEQMSDAEWREFAMTGTRTGKLAVTRADGSPHVTPVWFVLDGDDVVFTTHESSLKGKALRRDPRAAMCVDDQEPPYSYVILSGPVTLSTELDELVRWATVVGGRYMGEDRAREFGERNGVPGEMVVRLHPKKIVAERAVAD